MVIPRGLVTGIGSLPHTEADEALKLVLHALPFVPHWPQLPKRGDEDSFLGQYIGALVSTGVIERFENPCFRIDAADWEKKAAAFYALYHSAQAGDEQRLAPFSLSPGGKAELELFCAEVERQGKALMVKGQMSGPITLGLYIKDEKGRCCRARETARDMVVKSLTLHAKWQTQKLRELGLPVLVSVDEPGLFVLKNPPRDTVSAGEDEDKKLDRKDILADLNCVLDGISAAGGIPAVHVCADTDWSLIFASHTRVVSFDASHDMPGMLKAAAELERFLAAGGIMMWGIVPTDAAAFTKETVDLRRDLAQRMAALAAKGVDEARLQRQCMLSPACGTGSLGMELAERIYFLLRQLNEEFNKEYDGELPVFDC